MPARHGPWIAAAFACLFSISTRAEEWPRWLGPRGDGISQETALAQAWGPSGLRKAWSAPIGIGFSSPVAIDGRVYVFHSRGAEEHLTAFDAATGKVIWDEWNEGGWTLDYAGTRATPTIEGAFIYTYGGLGALTARMQETGKQVWRAGVLKLTGTLPLMWGVASSPLVVGDLIYVQTGRGGPIAAALNKKTGALVWKAETTGTAGYAAPVLGAVEGGQQLFLAAGSMVVGVNPDTGKQIWQLPFHIEMDQDLTTPTYREGSVFVTAGNNGGSQQIKVTASGATVSWATKSFSSRFNPVVYDEGYLYVNSEGTLKCFDWKTGNEAWSATEFELKLGFGGSIVRVGDKLVTLSDHGTLSLVEATPKSHRLVSQFKAVSGDQVWAVPLLYRNRVYVRGEKELTAWELPEPVSHPP